jgi:uncharacterized delta-60 repeat protein
MSRRRRRTLLAAAVSASLIGSASPAAAQGGELDPTFGDAGKVMTNFTKGLDEATDVALQDDGRIVAVGSAGGFFAIARYEADGDLDPTFSENGKVRTNFRGGADRATGVAIQPNGRIVAAGINGISQDGTFALARYLPDGTLDPAFGGDGKVKTNFTPVIDGAQDVGLQENGRILAVGFANSVELGHTGSFALARYRRNGTLDPSFGGNGKVRTNFTGDFDGAQGLAIQEDGRLVAAGIAEGKEPRFALAQYESDGALDGSFGGDGKVMTDFTKGGLDLAEAVAIQDNGKIVAVGLAREPAWVFALARYRRNGRLDQGFGANGKVRTSFGPAIDWARAVALQDDGKIVAAGFAEREDPFNPTFALARYNRDGTLDDTFSGNGKVRTDFTEHHDGAAGLALQPDGLIVAAGVAEDADLPDANPTFALARYTAA